MVAALSCTPAKPLEPQALPSDAQPVIKRVLAPQKYLKWLAGTYHAEENGRRFIAQWDGNWVVEETAGSINVKDYLVTVESNPDQPSGTINIMVWGVHGNVRDKGESVSLLVKPIAPDGFEVIKVHGMEW